MQNRVIETAKEYLSWPKRLNLVPERSLVGSGYTMVATYPDYKTLDYIETAGAMLTAGDRVMNSVTVVFTMVHPENIALAKLAKNKVYLVVPTTGEVILLNDLGEEELWKLFIDNEHEDDSLSKLSLGDLKKANRRPIVLEMTEDDKVVSALKAIVAKDQLVGYYNMNFDDLVNDWASSHGLVSFGARPFPEMNRKTFFRRTAKAAGIPLAKGFEYDSSEEIEQEEILRLLAESPNGIRFKSDRGIFGKGQLIIKTEKEFHERLIEVVGILDDGGVVEENLALKAKPDGDQLVVGHRMQITNEQIITTAIADEKYDVTRKHFDGITYPSIAINDEILAYSENFTNHLHGLGYRGDLSIAYMVDESSSVYATEWSLRTGGLGSIASKLSVYLNHMQIVRTDLAYVGTYSKVPRRCYEEFDLAKDGLAGLFDSRYLAELESQGLLFDRSANAGVLPLSNTTIAISDSVENATVIHKAASNIHQSLLEFHI